jgi:hypothetical protein
VPSNSKFERFGGYYIESQIKLLYKLEDLYFIFRDKEKAKEHLSIRIDDFEKLGLTELDISNFCDSDFYSDRCKKVLDNIHNGVESVL